MIKGVKRAVALALCIALALPFDMAYADSPSTVSPNVNPTVSKTTASPDDSSPDADAPDAPDSAEEIVNDEQAVSTDDSASNSEDVSVGDLSLEELSSEGTSLTPQDLSTDAAPLSPGTYLIHPVSSADKVIDIKGASSNDGAEALLYRSHLRTNQRFAFTVDDKGVYTIESVLSGKVLDIEGARRTGGTKVIQYHKNGGNNQKWTLQKNANGSYAIISALDARFVLDISGGRDADETNLIIWQRYASPVANQSFFLIPVQSTSPQAGDAVIQDGAYLIEDSLSPVRILDVTNNSTAQSAPIILWDENKGQNQKFVFSRDASGLYAICPLHSGKALAVLPPSRELVQMPYLANPSQDISYRSQRWVLSSVAGAVRITNAATGLVLDVVEANPKAGSTLITYPDHNAKNQRFTLRQVATDSLRAGIYALSPRSASTKRIDIEAASTQANARAIIWQANGGQNQKFQLESTEDGAYTLTSLMSGMRLTDVSGTVVQMPVSSADDQKWEACEVYGAIALKNRASARYLACTDAKNLTTRDIDLSSDLFAIPTTSLFSLGSTPAIERGYYLISTQAQGNRVLDVSGASLSSGANVLLWDKHGSANQIWFISQNSDGTYSLDNANSKLRLDVKGASKQSGTAVLQYAPHNNANQKWYIVPAGDGSFYLRSALGANLTLGAAGGGITNGSAAGVYTADGSDSQRFRFVATRPLPNLKITRDIRGVLDHGPKPAAYQKYIVLHDTEGISYPPNIISGWASNSNRVAAHFIVDRNGAIYQCVEMDRIAHHAGYGDAGHNTSYGVRTDGRDDMIGAQPIGSWAPDYGMNSWSIGIEMVHVSGNYSYPYTEAQLKALDDLILHIDGYYGFESTIIDHKAWRSYNSDTSAEFAGYLRNYQLYRHH